jgi:heme-degrading monooxygenase HmoA
LPGFVEGFVYENSVSETRHNVVTTAVWKGEDTFQNARKKAAEEFQRIGFNPPEIMKRLKVEIGRRVTGAHRIDMRLATNSGAMNGHAN